MYKSLLLLLALVCAANAATRTFNYTAGGSGKLWTDVTAWLEGAFPVAGDDVVINGGSTASGQQTLTLTTALTGPLNSLTLNASDVVVTIQSIGLAVTTLNINGGGALITGTQATGATLNVGTLNKAPISAGGFITSLRAMTLNVNSAATWTGNLDAADNLIINNPSGASWTWSILETDTLNVPNTGAFTLNNDGTMTLQKLSPQEGTKTLVVNGDMNIRGTVTVLTDCVLQAGSYGADVAQHDLVVAGTLAIDGSLYPTDNANTTFTATSSITKEGAIVYFAYQPGSALVLAKDFTWGNLQLQGQAHVTSNNAINIGTLAINGGTIDGLGPITVGNLTITKAWAAPDGSGTGAFGTGFNVIGRNITVTSTWAARNFPQFNLGAGANLIINTAAVVTYDCNTAVYNLDGSSVSIVSSGTWNANMTNCNTSLNVPTYFFGTINIPSGGQYTALNFTAGGQFHGNATIPAGAGYGSLANEWRVGLTAPFTIGSNAHFNGGLVGLTGGQFSFLGRSANNGVGSSILVSAYNNVVLSADGANVVLGNLWAQAGTVKGSNNFTVVDGRRNDIANLNSSSVWTIDTTNFVITGGFYFDTPTFALVNNGAIHVASTGTLFVPAGNLVDTASSTSGIYNRGTTTLTVTSANTAALNVNFWNAGQLNLARSGNTPAVLSINRAFQNQNSGIITLNVYSAASSDRIALTVGSNTCVFGGTMNLAFQYTPASGDRINILTTVDTQKCSGIFAVASTGVPSDHRVIIQYDQFTTGNPGANFFAIVCASTDNTCLGQGNRDPTFSSTTVMPTTGSSTTQGSGTTNGNTGGGSSASFLVAAPLLVLFSIFASLL